LLRHGDASGAVQRSVISEYTDMGVIAPARMLRTGELKYIHTHGHPAQLYDLRDDPFELRNLAGRPQHAGAEARMRTALLEGWDGHAVLQEVLASQRRRLYLKAAAQRCDPRPAWDFQAVRDDTRRFVRANGAAGAKALARFPYVPPTP
jgi:choline-sulfatase